ncbi:MAG: hypothetical protein V3V62_01770, partial [bacterium]
ILALNDPSTSALYYDNTYSGGVISLQVLPRHFSKGETFLDELKYIYRRMLSAPHTDIRTVVKGKFLPFERSVRLRREKGVERAEFDLQGLMGRRPTALARMEARERLEATQPFGGPRTQEEVKEERAFRQSSLTPAYTGSYRGKVVVYLREGRLYEFYYIDHAQAFENGLPVFDAFVGSMTFLPPGLLSRMDLLLGFVAGR